MQSSQMGLYLLINAENLLIDCEFEGRLIVAKRGSGYVDSAWKECEGMCIARLYACRVNQDTCGSEDIETSSGRSLEGDGLAIECDGEELVIDGRGDAIVHLGDDGLVPCNSSCSQDVGLSDGRTFHNVEVGTAVREESNRVVSVMTAVDEGVCPTMVGGGEKYQAAVFVVELEISVELG